MTKSTHTNTVLGPHGDVIGRHLTVAALSTLAIGDRVEGGDCDEDYDTGTVLGIEGERVLVAWDSGIRTSQPAHLLSKM